MSHTGPAASWYAEKFHAQIPRILTLLDRDPTSPTYGCFDRNYWHYRTQDFPSLMYQELALVLAHAYQGVPGKNDWKGHPQIRELTLAAVAYVPRATHSEGSGDDYFPFERALGATAFVVAACSQALLILNERPPESVAYLKKAAHWLLAHQETGRLSNHQALVALAAARTAKLTGDDSLLEGARKRLETCLNWQHEEGWFAEYEGADAGYQSLTITFLASLREFLPSEKLDEALHRALKFAVHFLHPDGSFAGETGSRNTCQVLPSGFECLAAHFPEARYLADGWLRGAMAGRRGYSDDDRIVSHWLQDFPLACWFRMKREVAGAGAEPWNPSTGITSFKAAHLHVIREGTLHLVIATNKGGVFRAYSGERLLRNDTGLVALDENNRRYASHKIDPNPDVHWEKNAVTIRGRFQTAKRKLATPFTQIIFRMVNLTLGRLSPNLLRSVLQKLLITGKKPVALDFERRIEWTATGGVVVTDKITAGSGAPRLAKLFVSTDGTSIYVATSNLWQEASLQPWEDVSGHLSTLQKTNTCEIVRRYQ